MAILKRLFPLVLLIAMIPAPRSARAESLARIGDLTRHEGDVPRRLVGYGLVVGLDGTGDRSFGGISSQNATVHSVVNLLRRFNVEVPAEYLRLRNVAAVLVTAEVSPYLRTGGRFEVQVSALGDAVSLEGGVLWMAPLVTDPGRPPEATAQGPVMVTAADRTIGPYLRPTNSGRIPEGGILETDPPPVAGADARLYLRRPDRVSARRIAETINQALGDGTAAVEDPGSIKLELKPENSGEMLAAIDTLSVRASAPARVVIHARDGLVVAGGEVRVGIAVVSTQGITLQIGGEAPQYDTRGLVYMDPEALVQDVAAGLHAVGARPAEIAAVFEALRDAGALDAEVVVR